jgi:septal ring factor EnvC (AmiA/AmiB activator)
MGPRIAPQASRWTRAVWYRSNLSRLRRTHIVLNELNDASPSGSDSAARKGRSPAFVALSSLAFVLLVVSGVYATIPVKQHEATAPPPPDPITQAIHDLQSSQRQAVDQLKALQETVSSDRAEVKRLSDELTALNAKLDTLQQSFASAQQPPSATAQPIEPERPKRRTR